MTETTKAMNIDDMILGTRCVEIARLDDVVIPMRAVSEREIAAIDYLANLAACVAMPTWLDQGSAAQDRLRVSKRWALLVARAALDPQRLLATGQRSPLFSPADAGNLVPADVDVLLIAQRRAQARANPALDEAQAREVMDAMRKREGRGVDALRARHASAADFFDVPSIEVTDWQLVFYGEVTR